MAALTPAELSAAMDYPGGVRQYHDTIRVPTRLFINCKGSKQGPDPKLN